MPTLQNLSTPQTAVSTSSHQEAQELPLLNPASSRWTAILVLLLLCGALFFYGLNVGQLHKNEGLRAGIAAEMLRTGNWLVPRLYGEPLLTKPPGMYAFIAAVSKPFGRVTEWTARLPSALAGTAVVLLFYWYASRQLGRLGGLIVAAITPCTFMWLDKASAAEIDMVQVFWVSASLLLFFRATEEHDQMIRWWLAALLCVAGGVLTKWTAPVFFYATAIPFLYWRGQLRLLRTRSHLISATIGAALCFGWAGIAIGQVGWETFYETVKAEALPRLSHEHNLSERQVLETLEYPFKLLLVNLPWSAFALLTFVPRFFEHWDDRARRLVQAFHCWTWPNIIMWTILPDHATRHSFPLFPGLTGLAGMAWVAFVTGRLPERVARCHLMLASAMLFLFAAAIVGGGIFAVSHLPSSNWWLILILAAMAGWSVREGFRARRAVRRGGMLLGLILTWVVFKVAYVHVLVPIRDMDRQPRAKAESLSRRVPLAETLYLFALRDEGIMFYYGRPVVRLKSWDRLPSDRNYVYCVLQADEWQIARKQDDWQGALVEHLTDAQGDAMLLVRLDRRDTPILQARVYP